MLVVVSGVSWGALDALRKALAADIPPLPHAALLAAGQLPVFFVWSLWSGSGLAAGYWAPGLADAAAALTASVLFVAALRVSPLSVCVPMLSLTPVFATVLAGLLLGEQPSGMQLAGVALVVLGALLLNRPQAGRGWLAEPGAWMMGAVAALWAATMTLDKLALQHAAPATHALTQAALICLGLFAILAARRELGQLSAVRGSLKLYLPAVVALCAATAAQLLAVQLVFVGLVEAIKRAVGLAMSVVSGRLFFDEPVTPAKLAAIGLMGAGAVLLSGVVG